MCYFFIFIYTFLYTESLKIRGMLFVLSALCLYGVFMSGTKTAMITIALGLIVFLIKIWRNIKLTTLLLLIISILIATSVKTLDYFSTIEQKRSIYQNLEMAYVGAGIQGFDSMYFDTSLGSRIDHVFRFFEGVKEEPELLVLGRGWHRRSSYETGISLHDDLLTATHDLGICGAVFVIWIYFAMFKQFSIKKNRNVILLEKDKLLQMIMQILVILLILSSFMGENLTLYGGGIDVQFPFIIMLMAVSWNYWKITCQQENHALLQKENIY